MDNWVGGGTNASRITSLFQSSEDWLQNSDEFCSMNKKVAEGAVLDSDSEKAADNKQE